jgi:hypothetical protein
MTEQPFVRLGDQLRMTVLTNKKEAPMQTLVDRIRRTVFYIAVPTSSTQYLKTVAFDEIARHVFRTTETLKYIDGLKD